MSPSYQNEGMSGGRHGTGYIDSSPYRSSLSGGRDAGSGLSAGRRDARDAGMSSGRGISSSNRNSADCTTNHNDGIGRDTFKNGWRVFRGAGEKLRGDVNSTLDGLGEDVAGRGNKHARPKTMSDGGARPERVAQRGDREMERGWKHFEDAC